MPTHRYGRWWCVGFCSLLILPKPTVTLDINQPTATKPNFILLMSDDMGVGDVSYNNVSSRINMPGAGGEEYIVNPPRTPNIDAMASSQNSIIFNRFYAGSGVCSPTRSAVLTGRTPDRECIFNAEGCGQEPAWLCADNLPLPPTTFTIAEAAKAQGYATMHVGKWHLGNFFPKASTKHSFANDKWPVSSPRIHGFDEWHSTEASASSSMCNCGCNASWPFSPAGDPNATQGVGCVTGGGDFTSKPLPCTNYWSPVDLDSRHMPTNANCSDPTKASLAECVGNRTTKITGDDTREIVDIFEDFLRRKAPGGPEEAPFMAVLWLHTNHEPHPAMPEWYSAYTDTEGNPAGDYLGTISQMDAQIGRLRSLLRQYNVADNTALWFTADNGAHLQNGDNRSSNQASNGLRQCKASLYEGGIRVAGVLEWPSVIKAHRETEMPAYVSDYLPTFLDAVGMAHPHPSWATDGMSLLPFLQAAAAQPATEPVVVMNRTKPLGFELGSQQAWIDNDWKLVRNGAQGQCATMLPPYSSGHGEYLFNLKTDPTESHDLSQVEPERFAAMKSQLGTWAQSIKLSQTDESECLPKSPAPAPTSPPGITLTFRGQCLTLGGKDSSHVDVQLGDCDGSLKTQWSFSNSSAKHKFHPHPSFFGSGNEVQAHNQALGNQYVLKRDAQDDKHCIENERAWMGKQGDTNYLVVEANATAVMFATHIDGTCAAPGFCLGIDEQNSTVLVDCAQAAVFQVE